MTSTVRGAPGEVVVGVDQGLQRTSAVNRDRVETVEKARLEQFDPRLRFVPADDKYSRTGVRVTPENGITATGVCNANTSMAVARWLLLTRGTW